MDARHERVRSSIRASIQRPPAAYADAMRTAKSANGVPSASALALISFFIVIAAARRSLSLRSRAILITASAESCCFRLRLSRGGAMAAKPSTWRLMGVVCGPREVDPAIRGSEEWCAWARGPDKERRRGTRDWAARRPVRAHSETQGARRLRVSPLPRWAGVTRPTVYRHFADMDEIFSACIAHWVSTNPQPDPGPWLAIEEFEARARRVLTDAYRWYNDVGYQLYPLYRDIQSIPPAARPVAEGWSDPLAGVILGDDLPAGRAGSRLRAVAMHLVRLMTWRSLVVDGGLSADEAAELGVRWLMAARDSGQQRDGSQLAAAESEARA